VKIRINKRKKGMRAIEILKGSCTSYRAFGGRPVIEGAIH